MASFNYADYDNVFNPTCKPPYSNLFLKEVEVTRTAYGGHLFIDRVLTQLGLFEPSAKIYPPKNDDSLRALHKTITAHHSLADHHKLSLLYYLLLDWDIANPRAALSELFAFSASVPSQYQTFIKGLWCLDRRDNTTAIQYLAHPSLPPTEFADDIILALSTQAKDGGDSRVLAYYHATKPALKKSEAIEALFDALAASNVVAALEFSRQYPEPVRVLLFQRLIASVLNQPASEGNQPADRATELVSLPFDKAEEIWFQHYLARGEGKKLRNSGDTLLMRNIAMGNYSDVTVNENIGPGWATLLEGLRNGFGGRDAL